MDPAGGGAGSDDFVGLLKRMGHIGPMGPVGPTALSADIPQTQATTILAFKFQGGVLVAGECADERAYRWATDVLFEVRKQRSEAKQPLKVPISKMVRGARWRVIAASTYASPYGRPFASSLWLRQTGICSTPCSISCRGRSRRWDGLATAWSRDSIAVMILRAAEFRRSRLAATLNR